MKKTLFIFISMVLFLPSFLAFAQQPAGGSEIPNLVSAVRAANPGDYIVLPSGHRYVLTAAEIEIVRGNFDYGDLSALPTETRSDGTEVIIITGAHTAYIFPDGQSIHMLRTSRSFSDYMANYVENRYYIGSYIDYNGIPDEFGPAPPRNIAVFRAAVEFQLISDGTDVVESVNVIAYNFRGRSFQMMYFPTDTWQWGYVYGTHSPVGEPRTIEFDVE